MASARYGVMSAQLKKLSVHHLQFKKSSSGSYSQKQLAAGAAYTLFAHAEIESYLESWSSDILERASARWRAGANSRAITSLLCFRPQIGVPSQLPVRDVISETIHQALSGHRDVIRNNHGIKEKHICTMFAPLGFDVRKVDPVLLGDLATLSSIRGDHAHQSYKKHLGAQFDPFDRQTKVNNLVALLKDLDDEFAAYKTKV